MTLDDRQQRERDFHNERFGSEEGRPADSFYAVAGASFRWYQQTVTERGAGGRVLEYGSGPGSLGFELARRGASVVGIDISDVAVQQGNERAEREGLSDLLEYRVMDAEDLAFDRDSFDFVCGSGILHHLDLSRAYGEVSRTLRPGGSAVFLEPLGHNPAINLYRRMTPEQRTDDEHPLVMGDLEQARMYFSEMQTQFFQLTSLLALPFRGRPRFDTAVRRFDALDQRLFSTVPGLRRFAWMVAMDLRDPA